MAEDEQVQLVKSFNDLGLCEGIQRACLRNPVKIEAASKYSTVGILKQQYLFVPWVHKDCYLVDLLTEMSGSTSMVFTRTSDSTYLLAQRLRNLGLKAIPIYGQMSQAKGLGALKKFKAGKSVNVNPWASLLKTLQIFPAQEEEVLLLLERVSDARRISQTEARAMNHLEEELLGLEQEKCHHCMVFSHPAKACPKGYVEAEMCNAWICALAQTRTGI
ncbi:hypothetical protein C3L33_20582, partial [Rhododendron williamsianum]